MNHRFHLFATGTNTGLTLVSLEEFLRSVNWSNLLTLAGSAVMTGISWYVSVRQAKREQDRLDREEARHQNVLDRLQELKLQKAAASVTTPPAVPLSGVPSGP